MPQTSVDRLEAQVIARYRALQPLAFHRQLRAAVVDARRAAAVRHRLEVALQWHRAASAVRVGRR